MSDSVAGVNAESELGVVVIGRNEGERLARCFQSVLASAGHVVYVDSDSSDGSVVLARSLDIHVVELDLTIPFTAGRARNEGFDWLMAQYPETEFVQFVDGDCTLAADWLHAARGFLSERADAAIVCGVRREIRPEASIFNFLCDIEWDADKGEVAECGGDFMVRAQAMCQVGGFDNAFIAGEEPELCFRIRREGWKVFRLDQVMTRHDADITRIGQWWCRAQRSGHAYAHVAYVHGSSPERIYVRPTLSNFVWGFALPLATLVSIFISPLAVLLVVSPFVYKIIRLSCWIRSRMQIGRTKSVAYGIDIMLGKIPHAIGGLQFVYRQWIKNEFSIIEYKN